MEYDAWSDLRKVFDAAAEKTGSAIAYSRLRLERAKCLNRLNGLYEELGRASYFALVRSREPDTASLVEQITRKRRELEELCAGLGEGSTVTCSFCAGQNRSDSTYCADCGAPLT